MNFRALALLALLVASSTVRGQESTSTRPQTCQTKSTAAELSPYRWLPNFGMTIHYAPGQFSERERAAFREAIRRWQGALARTNSGIEIRDAGETPSVPDREGHILVRRAGGMAKGRYGEIAATHQKDGYLTAATISVNASIKKPEELRRLLQHELGHAFGLLDCPSCRREATVMNYFTRASFNGISLAGLFNKVADAPTPCDVGRVASGYEQKPAPGALTPHDLIIGEDDDRRPGDGETVLAVKDKFDTTAPETGDGRGLVEGAAASSHPATASDKALIDKLIAQEAENTAALNNYTFKRDVLIQTIDPNGEVSGEYHRVSQMVFDDQGNRIEKVISFPKPNLKRLIITTEDVADLSGVQLLGLEASKAERYRIAYQGQETIEGQSVRVFKIVPADLAHDKATGERVFYGTVWADEKTMRITRLQGRGLPEGNQRFPVFETRRATIGGTHLFPVYTRADDVLAFPKFNVHLRVLVRFSDFKRFGSEVKILDGDPEETAGQ